MKRMTMAAVILGLSAMAATAGGQGMGGPTTKPRDDQGVVLVRPTVDRVRGMVTVPGAFWNQRLADWVEVAFCGRPSDFLHETLLCATTTREELEKSLREAGFRDADAWVDSVTDFPKVRGDRLLVLVQFSRDGREETYAVDELLSFQGWGTAVGPYGFMFKGDPERQTSTQPAGQPAAAGEPDSVKILRDDPQVALVFKGIQSMSQSFADHPIAYDDWIYPMLNFGRNLNALPGEVFNSNGTVPVTIVFRKVSDEELLTESARVWHDAGWREAIAKQVGVAKEIDAAKAELLRLRGEVLRARAAGAGAGPDERVVRQVNLLQAKIASGYATLDAAWAAYGAERAKFPEGDPQALAVLRDQAAKWREHLELKREAAAQFAIAQEFSPPSGPLPAGSEAALGKEAVAMGRGMVALNKQRRQFWMDELARLDPANDPRADWIKHVRLQVELADARNELGEAGAALGELLQRGVPADAPERRTASERRDRARSRVALTEVLLELAGVEFEISKREMLEGDPELPALRERKRALEGRAAQLRATTRPG